MNLKLDENLDARLTSVLRRAGHEVSTVREQGLAGVDDQALYVHCRVESRILVTLDLDFANVLRYPPKTVEASSFSAVRMTSSPPFAP
jgi:predicted nuclease of predicted toxin-antitoxin system